METSSTGIWKFLLPDSKPICKPCSKASLMVVPICLATESNCSESKVTAFSPSINTSLTLKEYSSICSVRTCSWSVLPAEVNSSN